MADRERIIKLKIISDFTEASRSVDSLKAKQAELAAQAKRLGDESDRRDADSLRRKKELEDYVARTDRVALDRLAVRAKAQVENLRKGTDAQLLQQRVEAAAAQERSLNASRDLKQQKDLRDSIETTRKSVKDLLKDQTASQDTKNKIIEIKADLDDKLVREKLRAIQAGDHPRVTMEAVLDAKKVDEKLALLSRRKIEIEADIDINQTRLTALTALSKSKGSSVGDLDVKKSENALQGLKERLAETEHALSDLGDGAANVAEKTEDMTGRMATFAKVGIPAVAAIVGALGPLIGELIQAAAGIISIGAAAAGAAVVIGVGLVTAFSRSIEAIKSFTKAQQETEQLSKQNQTALQQYQDQLDKMTPAGQNFTKLITGSILPAFSQLKAVSEQSFLPGITDGIENLISLTPKFEGLIVGAGKAVGDLVNNLSSFLTQGKGLADVQSFFGGIQDFINGIIPGVEQFGEALATIFGAGGNAAGTFADKFNDVATSFNDWIQKLSGDGRLQDYFDKAEGYLEDFLHLIGTIGGLIQQAFGAFTEGDGPSFLSFLSNVFSAIGDIFDAFNDFGVLMDGLKDLGIIVFGALYVVIAGVAGIAGGVAVVIGTIVDGVKKLLEYLHLIKKEEDDNKPSPEDQQKVKDIIAATGVNLPDGTKEDRSTYLADLQEGGSLANDMAAATNRASDAVKSLSSAHDNATKYAAQYGDAVQKIKDKTEAASRAVRDAKEALASLKAQDSDTLGKDQKDIDADRKAEAKAITDGLESVASAEHTLSQAHLASLKSQEDLNKARKEALQDLINLRKEVERGALNERKGALALRQAQQAYAAILKDPTASYEDREAARLDVESKKADSADLRDTSRQNRTDLNTAEKKGVEGSDKVKTALQNQIDATYTEKKAVEDLAKARQTAEDNYQKAVDTTAAAVKKLADDKAKFAIDERNAAERVTTAQQAYTDAIKDQQTQIDILKAKKKAAFDDEGLKNAALKKELTSQDFAGYGVDSKGNPVINKTLSSKDADEYIRILNGMDPGLRTALQGVGLPNSLAGLKALVAESNKVSKSSPKLTANKVLEQATSNLTNMKLVDGQLIDGRYTKDSKGRVITNPQYKPTFDSPSAGTTSSQSLISGYAYGPDGKVHKTTDPIFNQKPGQGAVAGPVASITGVTAKDLGKQGKDAGDAFGKGLDTGIKNSTGTLKTTLNKDISGSGGVIPKTVKDDLQIKSPSKVAFGFGGNFGQGLVDGLYNSVDTIAKAVDAVITGLGPKTIRGMVTALFELANGRSEWFFKMAGAMGVGITAGLDQSVPTIVAAVKRLTDAMQTGFSGPLAAIGALFSVMMDEASYNVSVGSNNILQDFRNLLTEMNKITSVYQIDLTPDALHDVPIIGKARPSANAAKARGGAAGAPEQGLYQRYETGGMIRGSGGGTEDKVDIRVSPREYIQPEHSVNYYGENIMEGIRTRSIPREALAGFARGGSPYFIPSLAFKAGGSVDRATGKYPAIDELIATMGKAPASIKVDGQNNRPTNSIGYRGTVHGKTGGNHDVNKAVDFNYGHDTDMEHNIAIWWLKNYGPKLKELIHTDGGENASPPYTGQYIKRGKVVPASFYGNGVAAIHRNHVHVAIEPGALIGAAPVGAEDPAAPGNSLTTPEQIKIDADKIRNFKLSDFITKAKDKTTGKTVTSGSKTFGTLGKVFYNLLNSLDKVGGKGNDPLIKRLTQAVAKRVEESTSRGANVDFGTQSEIPLSADDAKLIADIAPNARNINNAMREAYAASRSFKATNKQLLAMFETGIVESSGFHNRANTKVPRSLKNPLADGSGSDGTSVGIYQQQVGVDGKGGGFGWGDVDSAMDPYRASLSFLKAAKRKDQSGWNAGTLAWQVQQPNPKFRDRYQKNRANAIALLHSIDPKFTAISLGGLAQGGMAGGTDFSLSGFASGGMPSTGYAEAPRRSLNSAAQAVTNNNGFTVQNLNINNPMQERGGDSLYRTVNKMKTIYG